MQDTLDRVGSYLLIYEGFVLASRVVNPRLRRPPAISQVVWRMPLPARFVVSLAVGGYLGWHWCEGPRVKASLVPG